MRVSLIWRRRVAAPPSRPEKPLTGTVRPPLAGSSALRRVAARGVIAQSPSITAIGGARRMPAP